MALAPPLRGPEMTKGPVAGPLRVSQSACGHSTTTFGST